MARAVEGAALLVAGHGAIGGTKLDASAVHTLGQIGEALLATGTWRIRRLSAAAGERNPADRGTLKRHLDELADEPVRLVVLVVLGVIVDAGGPALVTSSELRAYPEDATLPLGWIGERLRRMKAEQVVVVFAGRPDKAYAASTGASASTSPMEWLGALGTGRNEHVIATASADAGAPIVDALLAGLCGDALDPRTGTVTMSSLSKHLGERVPSSAIQTSEASETFTTSPPLAGLWDVRRSQMSLLGTQRARKRPATGERDDLTGTVLPGRFRLDGVVARGTFGTVYRAHQLSVERDVAVKVLHADIDPISEDGRLFVHEVRAVGRIDHPHVVRIHQADITGDGRLFYAMELLDGRDLQALAAEGPMPQARAIELVRQLLAGLGAAHEAGLVHADVKPANAIVVERDGAERVVLVDFGLARLRHPDRATESAGGTPAFMAPEQLHEGRVDARSDLFSVALVLVNLLTGWRRTSAQMIVPPLDGIADSELREVLAKALAVDPGDRYQSARELAAALGRQKLEQPEHAEQAAPVGPILPFRLFAPLTEADRGRLHGRELDVATLTEHVLYRRSVIYTAPSGTGKTSLLRAGLVPRLDSLGITVVYLRCRNAASRGLAAAIAPDAADAEDSTVAEAVARHHAQRGGKLVLVLDQLEAALADGDLVEASLDFAHWPETADVSVVLSIREDHLARLVARTQKVEPGMPILRLPPLTVDGARAAIVGPLNEARLAIEPELLDALLADLRDAATALAPEMGWGDAENAVYPPHLQLACSLLFEALGSGEATLTLAHYKRLGGFAAIVGEHLERVLDLELADGRDVIARDLFTALVTAAHERAVRPEAELLAIVGARHERHQILAVLEILRQRGLLLRVRGDGEPSWELVHDSLVPRVLAWIDRKDLARRRAIELVRHHLLHSQPDSPSLLDRKELRELRAHEAAIAELDEEWRTTRGSLDWTPLRLVRYSRRVLRRRAFLFGSALVAALAVASIAVIRNRIDAAERARDVSLRDRDMGRFTLELEMIEWDPTTFHVTPVDARELPGLRWELHYPIEADPTAFGAPFEERHLVLGKESRGATYRQPVEAHGGHAVLVVSGRSDAGEACSNAVIPVILPGYGTRSKGEAAVFSVKVPTCRATRAGMIQLAAGPFIYGGLGEPPMPGMPSDPSFAMETRLDLPAFAIDRTEVTNAAFGIFTTSNAEATGIKFPTYPRVVGIGTPGEPMHPVTYVSWTDAKIYCRWLGKRLPTTKEWVRALRGGERLADGSPNPHPRRTLPWGDDRQPPPTRIGATDDAGTVPVGSNPEDRSPDGVLDLAGNAVEWTDSSGDEGFRLVRGGGAFETMSYDELLRMMGSENPRLIGLKYLDLGLRSVYDGADPET
ncbi:MAG: SUMF1/EgtB/PvdO family nonheme iron enzyme [Kofleriaceae bacterium]|nr:SUMF1/EgtB/PvdO family nonheme iron enzyme [Kofleriaceae bacterium]